MRDFKSKREGKIVVKVDDSKLVFARISAVMLSLNSSINYKEYLAA